MKANRICIHAVSPSRLKLQRATGARPGVGIICVEINLRPPRFSSSSLAGAKSVDRRAFPNTVYRAQKLGGNRRHRFDRWREGLSVEAGRRRVSSIPRR